MKNEIANRKPDFVKKMELYGTTVTINGFFSTTTKDTINDVVARLIKREVKNTMGKKR